MIWKLRAILFAILFYAGTFFWVIVSLIASLFSHRAVVAAVMGWTRTQQVLADRILDIRTRMVGEIPSGAYLIAVKHQAIYETLEVVRLADAPVLVIKRELADLPLFGKVTRLYGIIAVERTAGAKALRAMLTEGKKAIGSGRRIVIYPEGTRVPVGTAPPLQSGFAGLYRALGLPVVPIAVDSGRLWGKGLARHSGLVTLQVGEVIPPGLPREQIEARVHAAINALEPAAQSAAQPRP